MAWRASLIPFLLAGHLGAESLDDRWHWLAIDFRRRSFLLRLSHQIGSERAWSNKDLAARAVERLTRMQLDPITWLRRTAPAHAQSLIAEVSAEVRRQNARVNWTAEAKFRASRLGRSIAISLFWHAGRRDPVPVMIFHLLHELRHSSDFPPPARGQTLAQFRVTSYVDLLDEEVEVRLAERSFLARMARHGIRVPKDDLMVESIRIWRAHDAGESRASLQDLLKAKYGELPRRRIRALYLASYATYDAEDVGAALNLVGEERQSAFVRVIWNSPAVRALAEVEYAAYVDRIVDKIGADWPARRGRKLRRSLLAVKPDQAWRCAETLRPRASTP